MNGAAAVDTLQFFGMEEGGVRVSPSGVGGFVYDYFLTDHLGNTRMVITDDYNAPSPILETDNYYPFGLKMAAISYSYGTHVKNPYQYGTGSEFNDVTGWNEFALRDYDPQIGRFVQADPFDQFASGYAGNGNDPINNVDPSGGFSIPGAAIGTGTGFLLGMAYGFATTGDGDHMLKDGLIGAGIGGAIGGFGGDLFSGSSNGVSNVGNNLLVAANSKAAMVSTWGAKALGTGGQQLTVNPINNSYVKNTTSSNSIFQNVSNVEWNGLYKSDLINYYKSTYHTEPTAKQLGDEYEKIFYDWESPRPVDFKMNDKRWEDAQGRNTVPDMTAMAYYQEFEDGTPVGPPNLVPEGSAYEVKAGNKGIYLSSNDAQIKGHLDNMAARFKKEIAKGFEPQFTLVTVQGVPYSEGIHKYASDRHINFTHLTGLYRIVNGRWEFRFINSMQRFWYGLKRAFKGSL